MHGQLTESVIGAFYDVYNELRYGFLEQIYVEALVRLLRRKGHEVQREVPADVYFQGDIVGRQKLDIVVDRKLVLEIKSTHDLNPICHRQLLSYLRATGLELGLVLHFGPEAKFYRTICTLRSAARRPPGLESV